MKHLYCGSFRELQARFITNVGTLRESDPLAPLDVVVTGQLARLALKRELARSGCSHANISFWTLHELAEHETEDARRQLGLRALPDFIREPLMLRAIETASPLEYFGALSSRDGFRAALWRTLDDLRGAGVDGALLERLSEKKIARNSILGRKLRDLAALLLALEKLLGEHSYADTARAMELAIATKRENSVPMILYGVDEMTALELRFFEAQFCRSHVAVYLPYRNDKDYQWVQPLFAALAMMGFTPEFADELESVPEIRMISAPARDREIEEIVSDIMQESETGTRIGILLRDGEKYVPLLRETLTQAGLTGYFHQCLTLGETTAGRSFRLLSTLLDLKFARTDVMEFLLSSPVIWPETIAGANAEPPAALWNQLTLLAGITSGEESWRDGLRRLRNRLEREQQAEEDDDDSHALPLRYRDAIESFRQYIEYLFRGLREIRTVHRWSDAVTGLETLYSRLVEESEESASLLQEWQRMTELDELRIAPTVENIRMQVNAMLRKPAKREGRFQTHEPTAGTVGETQGIIFDNVYIPGMVERELPRPVSQDPLLLDDERRLLQQWIGTKNAVIPLRSDRRYRERFAFTAAMTSARRRVVLLYPRREAGGRERLPSSYLLDVLESLTGQAADYDALDRHMTSHSSATRLSAGRLRVRETFPATPLVRELSLLGTALDKRTPEPISELLDDHPLLGQAMAAEKGRFRQSEFSRFDGLIEDETVKNKLDSHLVRREISPTRMEQYARCPFRFLALYVLNLNPVDEPEELSGITALQRGLLVHWILERFFRDEQAAERIPLQRGTEARLAATARRIFTAFERDIVTGPALLWRIEQTRIMQALQRFVEREFEDKSGYIPRHFETEFTFDYSGCANVAFHGKMDRVDVHPTDGTVRVIDYKSGKPRSGMKDGSLCGGQALQLPVYRLAAEQVMKAEGAVAAYYYLMTEDKKARIEYSHDHWRNGQDIFARTVATIVAGIANGYFYPYPEQANCSSCAVRAACGTGRFTPKWKRLSAETEEYAAMREGNA